MSRSGQKSKFPGFWTLYYRMLFRLKGIRFGKGLKVYGPILLRVDGDPRNILIGSNVTIMPWVDIKNRENGKIILNDGVTLDTTCRLVAAREGCLELKKNAQVGIGSIINAGADVLVGERTLISGYCTIIASEHNYGGEGTIMEQGYRRAPVYIGEDAWLATGVLLRPGSRIGNRTVVGAKSLVSGELPDNCVAAGNPASPIRFY